MTAATAGPGAGFADLVGPDGVALGVVADSKDALLAALAAAGARVTGRPAPVILAALLAREALGTTGFGQGAAIPHARLEGLPAATAVVARLATGVSFGALDGDPVDVAVLLLSPAGAGAGADHLKALARVSRALRDPATLAAIRAAGDEAALRSAIGAPAAHARRAA